MQDMVFRNDHVCEPCHDLAIERNKPKSGYIWNSLPEYLLPDEKITEDVQKPFKENIKSLGLDN